MNLTKRIIISMVAALVLGLIVNQLASEGTVLHQWVHDYLVTGLLLIVAKIFVAGLKVIVVPLVFVSLVYGTASLGDTSRLGRFSIRTIGLYLITTSIALVLAIAGAYIVQPGLGISIHQDIAFQAKETVPFTQVLIDMFPTNPIEAMAEGNMLQIIVFAILLGFAINHAGEHGRRVAGTFADWNHVVLRLVSLIMHFAPYGVFALLFNAVATQGFDKIRALAAYFMTVLAVLLVHAFIVYPIILAAVGRLNPWIFLKKVRAVQTFAFSTSSSGATIPVTLSTAERRLGVENALASFTVPLGATINMDGTAIMQGVATVFIAQMYGVELGLSGILIVIGTATIASIGTAGVPSVGLVMLAMVLTQVGLPVDAIALIMGVDRLLDMTRTAVNVTGDLVVTAIVARMEGLLDVKVYEDPNAGEQEEDMLDERKVV